MNVALYMLHVAVRDGIRNLARARLPAQRYPSSLALVPVPSSTTASIIFRMVMAVSGRITRTGGAAGSVWSPSRRINCGFTSIPPLAITEQARASCRVVTLTSWPIDTEASDVASHFFRSLPFDSAGSSMPVRSPTPKGCEYLYRFACPTFIPHLDGADIARLRQHHGHRNRSEVPCETRARCGRTA